METPGLSEVIIFIGVLTLVGSYISYVHHCIKRTELQENGCVAKVSSPQAERRSPMSESGMAAC
jgi:hypothetical protein